jgi:hypothetical protein
MAPPLDTPSAAPHLPAEPMRSFPPGMDPERLRKATAQLRALGIDDEVVFSSDSPEEVLAYLASIPACEATS